MELKAQRYECGMPTSGPAEAAVYCDPINVGRLAAQHLRERGHRNLACLCLECKTAQQQQQAFLDAAREYDVELKTMTVPWSNGDASGLYYAAITSWLRTLPRSTGLFVTCDRLGANTCELARESKIAVPTDWQSWRRQRPGSPRISSPVLSTVEQPSGANWLSSCDTSQRAAHRQRKLPDRDQLSSSCALHIDRDTGG